MGQHALDVLEHVARAQPHQLALAAGRLVVLFGGHSSSASIHSMTALRWSSQVSSSRWSALRESSSSCQLRKLLRGLNSSLLQVGELAREQPGAARGSCRPCG